MNWIDGHCHLADPRFSNSIHDVVSQAQKLGISHFVQGGVDPADWSRQTLLAQQYPGIIMAFGLHPYFVAENSLEDCELALDNLAQVLPKARLLGEAGLDFRPKIAKQSEGRQIEVFQMQIEMANLAKKPMVLHLVRAHDEALRIFEFFGQPKQGAMVHAFNGSMKQAQDFIEMGFFISIGGPICREDNLKLHQAVQHIPLENLILETDSPDQAPPQWDGGTSELNQPSALLLIAKKVAEIKSQTLKAVISPQEVLDRSSQNLRNWLGL